MNDSIKILLLISVVVAIFIFGPILTIWSLNTLFPILAIPYTIETWAATWLLFAGVSGVRLSNKK